ncbi:hypothetical protein [Pedobacter zeae]|nr:hypothetical protein [Pedobacter zeae]MBB4107651.1 hypothetical protein [Pedobacter zeae]
MKILLQSGNFVQKDHQSLSNADHFPWVSITLVEAKRGGFSSSKRQTDFINLIDIVCSSGKNTDQQLYLKTFLAIAEKLQWNLYLEADDEGNENVIIERMH